MTRDEGLSQIQPLNETLQLALLIVAPRSIGLFSSSVQVRRLAFSHRNTRRSCTATAVTSSLPSTLVLLDLTPLLSSSLFFLIYVSSSHNFSSSPAGSRGYPTGLQLHVPPSRRPFHNTIVTPFSLQTERLIQSSSFSHSLLSSTVAATLC